MSPISKFACNLHSNLQISKKEEEERRIRKKTRASIELSSWCEAFHEVFLAGRGLMRGPDLLRTEGLLFKTKLTAERRKEVAAVAQGCDG